MKTLRVLFAGLVAAMPLIAWAEAWRSTVDGPGALPDVSVAVGYPDGYVSSGSSPIVLDIRTGERAFDGYVGFHIAQGTRKTVDGAVASRVTLAPRSAHRFSTWTGTATFHAAALSGREVVIDWRDRDLRIIASKSAGAPPWEFRRPLILPFDGLGTSAQWYAGFCLLVTPTDHWFALPREVREAVFHSAIPVVFAGVPSTVPSLTDVDRALLPVDFRPGAGVLDVPWPYAAAAAQRRVAVMWTAKEGTRSVGSADLPYLVQSRVAAFAAGEEALDVPLPGLTTHPLRERAFDQPVQRRPRVAEIFRDMHPLLIAIVLLPIPFLGWTAMRRRPRWTIVAALALLATGVIAVRGAVRVTSGDQTATLMRIHPGGVVDTVRADRDSGAVPMPSAAAPAGDSVTRPSTSFDGIEVRTSGTAPGFGAVDSEMPWETIVRTSVRRDAGSPSAIRTHPAGNDALVVSFEAPMPVDYVSAVWLCGERRCSGTAAAGGNARGEVTVRNGIESWSCPECSFEVIDGLHPHDFVSGFSAFFSGFSVALIRVAADGAVAVRHLEPLDAAHAPPYSLRAQLERKGTLLVASFFLPSRPTATLQASLDLYDVDPKPSRITVRGAGGAVEIAPGAGLRVIAPLADGALHQIAPEGGIVIVEMETAAPVSPLSRAFLRIDERKR